MRERKSIEKRNSAQFAAICDALLRHGANVRFRAHGQSMQPNVLENDAVIVAPAEQKLERGDVALTHGKDGFRVHRVCFADGSAGEIVTRGDAGQENDAAVNVVLGKVVAIERNGQKVSMERPGIKCLHAARVWIRRLWLASTLRLGRLSASSLCFGLIAAFGLLLNATPVAAQADLTMSQTTSVSVVDTGINFNYTEIATNKGPNAGSRWDASRLSADAPQYHTPEHHG